MRCFVSGTAGFIGYHVATRLLDAGWSVVGYDGMTACHDVSLKEARHRLLGAYRGFTPVEGRLEDTALLSGVFAGARPDIVIHLASQTGVRSSIENPRGCIDADVVGTLNLLECCRSHRPRHLLLASTGSAYGGNPTLPSRERDPAAWPLTLDAATKIGAEVMAHAYSHLWAIPTTVFRFFTAYGPWGRPDTALSRFTKSILDNEPIEIHNHGRSTRDFTFIDDLVESIARLVPLTPATGQGRVSQADTLSPVAPHRVVNIGGGTPVCLLDFVDAIEQALGRAAQRIYSPVPAGDVVHMAASPDLLRDLTGFVPRTPLSVGVPASVAWWRDYYRPVAPVSPAAILDRAVRTPVAGTAPAM